jgi:hypothetical protein
VILLRGIAAGNRRAGGRSLLQGRLAHIDY